MKITDKKTTCTFNKQPKEKEMSVDEKIKARKAFQKKLHEEFDSLKSTKDQVQKVFDI